MKTSWKKLDSVREWLYRLAQVFIIHPIEMNLENNIKNIYIVTFSRLNHGKYQDISNIKYC